MASLNNDLSQKILDLLLQVSPSFFEEIVLKLLLAMGYGGMRNDAGTVTSSGKDGGIDGIINEDKLGLDVLYIQAKRWDLTQTVSRPEIQKFVGALHGKKAQKGIFITTASFSQEARNYAKEISPHRVILIDGERLAELMIDHNVGVSPVKTYTVKKADSDFFLEE